MAGAAPDPVARPLHERIGDPVFREAVACVDAGDVAGLSDLLAAHPELTQATAHLPGEGYFEHPSLPEFIAENPVRHGHMPDNIADVARTILNADPPPSAESIASTLGLVCSGRVVRECGYQGELIALLCAHGADPSGAMLAALGHGELAAARALLAHGAEMSLPVAAGLGLDAAALLAEASPADRHLALALAAQHGHADIVAMLLAAGENPDRYNPDGAHGHSTPLHQAALAGHADVIAALLAHGARLDIADKVHMAQPWQWARHAGHEALAERLHPPALT